MVDIDNKDEDNKNNNMRKRSLKKPNKLYKILIETMIYLLS